MLKQRWCGKVAWIAGMAAISALLVGCDGSINFSDSGAIEGSRNLDIFRGYAVNAEMVQEDPDRTEQRRTMVAQGARMANVDLDGKFLATLKNNPHFSQVVVNTMTVPDPRSSNADAVEIANVEFLVDQSTQMQLRFLVPERRMLGFVRLNKLPTLIQVHAHRDGHELRTSASDLEVLLSALNRDQSDFVHQIQAQWKDPTPAPVPMVTVPSIEGLCATGIEDKVKAAGLVPQEATLGGPVDKDAAAMGCAYRQSPTAGESVPKGSTLSYRVWIEGS